MSINLHTAKVYQIKYSDIICCGNESYDVFRNIFIDAGMNVYDEKEGHSFIVPRREIDVLWERLQNISEKDAEDYKDMCNGLNTISMDVPEFCQILKTLSSQSDPANEHILLEWY